MFFFWYAVSHGWPLGFGHLANIFFLLFFYGALGEVEKGRGRANWALDKEEHVGKYEGGEMGLATL